MKNRASFFWFLFMGSSGLSTRGGEKRRGRPGGGQIEEEDPVDKSKRKTRWTNRRGRPGGQTRKTKLDSSFCRIRRLWTLNLGLDVLDFLMCEAVRKKEMRATIYEDTAVVLGWSGEVVEQGEQSSKALRSRAEQRS
ncbi:hypothetical protein DVH24_015168 [Malus domestica]|uniref:Uncharacterized protein n=1 Tax=Malus domestica TaxID=3750 RepID=A0A498K0X2_MALDO|nr:hypothetical protein DVH24_015168 [Malus domestica]